MSDPTALLARALGLIDQHLAQLQANTAPLGSGDAGVIERYTKILITLTKGDSDDEYDNKTDEELQALANGDE